MHVKEVPVAAHESEVVLGCSGNQVWSANKMFFNSVVVSGEFWSK